MKTITGKVKKHVKGFAFLIPDEPEKSDNIFIHPEELTNILQGDRVRARLQSGQRGMGPRGEIIEVLDHSQTHCIGRIAKSGGMWWLKRSEEDPDPDLMLDEDPRLPVGTLALAQIATYPAKGKPPKGFIVKALDDKGSKWDVLRCAVAAGWPFEFSKSVEHETEQMKLTQPLPKWRTDLRNTPFVTIDGEDAKDFDDAVAAIPSPNGPKVYVAIADVSQYVTPDSATDKEAFARATSVYFPGTVIPMLPEKLSNELCSLKPQQERDVICCELHLDMNGKIKRSKFYSARIKSRRRCTYAEVETFIQTGKLPDADDEVIKSLQLLNTFFEKLLSHRKKRGALDFDLPETRVYVDAHGSPTQIVQETRYQAHKLIEEWMIAANVAAAEFLDSKFEESVFRYHGKPEKKKLEMFINLAKAHFPRDIPSVDKIQQSTLHLQTFLGKMKDPAKRELFHMLALRSLPAAIYHPGEPSHYGLALPHYTHFTSPIRRYPDLMVHRMIRSCLPEAQYTQVHDEDMNFDAVNAHCSVQERKAMELEWKVKDIKKARFMEAHVDEDFKAKVIGVTSAGMFVRLLKMPIEGLVPLDSLPLDSYKVDDSHQRIIGRKPEHRFQLGDEIQVQCTKVNIDIGQVTFGLIYDGPHAR